MFLSVTSTKVLFALVIPCTISASFIPSSEVNSNNIILLRASTLKYNSSRISSRLSYNRSHDTESYHKSFLGKNTASTFKKIGDPRKSGQLISSYLTASSRPPSPNNYHEDEDNDDFKRNTFFENYAAKNKWDDRMLIGFLVLLTVPLSWGTYAPVVKYVYEMDPPTPGFVFSAGYYAIASLTLLFLSLTNSESSIPNHSNGTISPNFSPKIIGGMELGSYLFLGNCLQVVGLESIPADRAAFLVQLTTIMVPILQATFARDFTLLPITTWAACLLSFVGVLIMGLDDRSSSDVDLQSLFFHSEGGGTSSSLDHVLLHHDLFSISGGDFLIILAALCYSMHVIRLGKYAKVTYPLELAASKATVEAVLSVALVLGFVFAIPGNTGIMFVDNESWEIQKYFSQIQCTIAEGSFPPDGFVKAVAASLWTGLVTCAYTIYAQSFGQRRVDPTDANLIYTMQPVFSAFFAWALLGERLGVFGYGGAALIGLALWIVVTNNKSS